MDKKRALKDLIDLNYAQGYHSGRWRDELDMEASAEEYLATMIMFAETYKVEYDKELEHYIDDENDPKCYAMDAMGFEIKISVEKHLINLLLE